MVSRKILFICILVVASTSRVASQTERPERLPDSETERFRRIELSIDFLKPAVAFALNKDLYIQAGVAYRFRNINRVRFEFGYAKCFEDTFLFNAPYTAYGSFARFYYSLDILKFFQLYTGLQGGAYQEVFKLKHPGFDLESYDFKDRYGGVLVGMSVQSNATPWLGIRAYAQTGVYTFSTDVRPQYSGPRYLDLDRVMVIGNGLPLEINNDLFVTLSVGVELLFYF